MTDKMEEKDSWKWKKASAKKEAVVSARVLAKKDFVIRHNEYERVIKAGDDLSDVPQMYLQNLKTEGVI